MVEQEQSGPEYTPGTPEKKVGMLDKGIYPTPTLFNLLNCSLLSIVIILSCTPKVTLNVEELVYEPITLEGLGAIPLYKLGEPFGDVPEVETVNPIAVWAPVKEVAKKVYTTITVDTVVLPCECVPVVDTVIEYRDIDRDFRWLFMLTNSVSVLVGILIGVLMFVYGTNSSKGK